MPDQKKIAETTGMILMVGCIALEFLVEAEQYRNLADYLPFPNLPHKRQVHFIQPSRAAA